MIVIDTETTGLPVESTDIKMQPGIVQIGALLLDDQWNIIEEYKQLVNPERFIEEESIQVHGITEEMVRRAAPLPVHLLEFSRLVRRAETWVGFNLVFDKRVLGYQLQRYQWDQRFPWPSKEVDVMKIAKDVANIQGKQDQKYPSLVELHQMLFGESFASAHDALADCRATVRCGKALWEQGFI